MTGRRLLVIALVAAVASLGPAVPARGSPPSFSTGSVRTGFPLAEVRVEDVDGKPGAELVVVGARGEVRIWRTDEGGRPAPKGAGTLVLPEPRRTLLATGDLPGTGGPLCLASLSPKGLFCYRLGEDGGYSGPGERMSSRARFRLRLPHPRFARFLRDINDDDRPDLLLPGGEKSEVWINEGPGDGESKRPRLRKAAEVRTDLSRFRTTEGDALSDRLESGFRIPYLTFEDVNGDRRPDLLVIEEKTRAFHLQREDGSVPAEPDIVLNLRIFRDTTPEASVRPGHTLAGGDDASVAVQDLDGDGIPDYVISHRRKIWIFHGTKAGPQFTEPSSILKVAEDVSGLLVLPLDDDAFPDLMLARLQVPTIATILKGLYSEWEVTANAVGYQSKKGRTFERTPSWRGTARLRLPDIIGSVRNPEALIRKFEEVGSKFRDARMGDLDGDGTEDVVLVSKDRRELQVWRSKGERKEPAAASGLAGLFFGEEEKVLTLDDALALLAGMAEEATVKLTGGTPPEARVPLLAPGRYERILFKTADLTGDGRREIVVAYRDLGRDGEGVLEVHRME